jgi:hypothetical protein
MRAELLQRAVRIGPPVIGGRARVPGNPRLGATCASARTRVINKGYDAGALRSRPPSEVDGSVSAFSPALPPMGLVTSSWRSCAMWRRWPRGPSTREATGSTSAPVEHQVECHWCWVRNILGRGLNRIRMEHQLTQRDCRQNSSPRLVEACPVEAEDPFRILGISSVTGRRVGRATWVFSTHVLASTLVYRRRVVIGDPAPVDHEQQAQAKCRSGRSLS